MSLRFYREENPSSVTVGSTYNGRTVDAKLTGFESSSYTSYYETPWGDLGGYENAEGYWISYSYYLREIVFEDYIYPTSAAYWFSEGNELKSIDVTKLDISNVTDMSYMFGSDYGGHYNVEIIGIENWDTSKVTNMNAMFGGTTPNNFINLSNWNVCNVTEYNNFSSSENIKEPYFESSFCSGEIEIKGDAYAVYSKDDKSLRFYRSETPITVGSTYNGRTVTSVFTDFENIEYGYPGWSNSQGGFDEGDIMLDGGICGVDFGAFGGTCFVTDSLLQTSVNIIVFEDWIYPVNTSQWFYNVDDLDEMDLSKLDTSNVTSMYNMFYGASINGVLDLSHWNVCRVNDHSGFADVSSGTILEPNWGMACP